MEKETETILRLRVTDMFSAVLRVVELKIIVGFGIK